LPDGGSRHNASGKNRGSARCEQTERGYGGALMMGFQMAQGQYFLTMDADLPHSPEFVRVLWSQRENSDRVIASRYVDGGRAIMPWSRYVLSRTLNAFFSRGLDRAYDSAIFPQRYWQRQRHRHITDLKGKAA
jgi:glycosyltransferase involved in cell wall biosynthesis